MLKKVVGSFYAHNSNFNEWKDTVLKYMDKQEFQEMMDYAQDVYDSEIGIDSYVLKYDKPTNRISIIATPDWDIENEPTVGDSICVWRDADGDFKFKKMKSKNQIYHNKWQFVQPDYAGFDVEAAKERTKLWNSIPDIAKHKSRIGYRSYWNDLLAKNGIEESFKLSIRESILTEAFTKEQVQKLFDEVYQDFTDYSEELDFCADCRIDPVVKWTRTNATRKLGHCKWLRTDSSMGQEIREFEIALNPILLQFEDSDERMIKDTIAHELCHTLPGCLNHGNEFHRKAGIIKNLLGYTIDTRADEETSKAASKVLFDNAPYKVICQNCGNEIRVLRLNDMAKQCYSYRCKKCGEPYQILYKLNKKTGEYEYYDKKRTDAFRFWYRIPLIDEFEPINQ